MSPKQLERIAIALVFAVLLLEGLCVVWLRSHYMGLFGAASSPRPGDLTSSHWLLWTMGVGCLVASLLTTFRVVRDIRTWLASVLLVLCFLETFLAVAVIYAMLVIQGWV